MERSKGWLLFAVLVLGICLAFTLLSVEALQDAAEKNRTLQAENAALGDALERYISECKAHTRQEENEQPTMGKVDDSTEGFVVRSVNGRIAVYDQSGFLVRLLEINPTHLPATDREALARGITLSRWEDVLSLIEDYTA